MKKKTVETEFQVDLQRIRLPLYCNLGLATEQTVNGRGPCHLQCFDFVITGQMLGINP